MSQLSLPEVPATSWLVPRTEVVDKKLKIAPSLVEQATKALEAAGYENVSLRTAQSVDTTNPKDSGHPGHEISGKKADGEEARVAFRCVRDDTDKQFWPQTTDANLGEAVAAKERCMLRVAVMPKEATRSDRARAKALFGKLLAHEPAK